MQTTCTKQGNKSKMDCLNLKKGIAGIFIIVTFSVTTLAQTGSIEGVVADKNSREALPGVTITIDGTTTGTSADIEGHFLIPNVKPGRYKLKISYNN